MTDYSKWKVNDLKAELKRRGISQTGLRVKQDFIDKLLEADAAGEAGESAEETFRGPEESTDVQDTAAKLEKGQQPAESEQRAQQPTSDEPQEKPDEQIPDERKPEQEQETRQDTQPGDAETCDEPMTAEPTAEGTPRGKDAAKPKDEPMTDTADENGSEEKKQEGRAADADKEAEKAPEGVQVAEVRAPQPQLEEGASAQPVPQARGDVVAEEATPVERGPGSAEVVAPSDNAEPVAKAPEVSAELSVTLPVEEVIEDKQKRKRRSQSPIATPEALANKKSKTQDETPRVVLPEDREGLSTEEQLVKNQVGLPEDKENSNGAPISAADESRSKPPKQDARFKGLFAGTEPEQTRPASPPADTEMKDAEVEPAIHPATAALYIGGLMRPLKPVALRNHLVSLASAPGTSPNPDLIHDYHLDSIKTHCLVNFRNVSAASRVRSALHGTVWPNERNRKALFVDFVPEQKIQQWIDMEEESGRRGGPKPRWEIRYGQAEGGVEAVLEQVDLKSARNQPPTSRQESSFHDTSRAPPAGPRADRERFSSASGPARPPPQTEFRPSRPGQGFKPLDELFRSTIAKPKLYYLPVSREMAHRRLDRFDDLLQKGEYPRRGGDETRRITFEGGDYFVDNGPEFTGGRGRGGRRGRGRGGGFGDSWRS